MVNGESERACIVSPQLIVDARRSSQKARLS